MASEQVLCSRQIGAGGAYAEVWYCVWMGVQARWI